VIAVELSQIAVVALIEQLSTDFGFDFEMSEQNNLIHYHIHKSIFSSVTF
jgi:thiopurine S-methyltransferase